MSLSMWALVSARCSMSRGSPIPKVCSPDTGSKVSCSGMFFLSIVKNSDREKGCVLKMDLKKNFEILCLKAEIKFLMATCFKPEKQLIDELQKKDVEIENLKARVTWLSQRFKNVLFLHSSLPKVFRSTHC